MASDSLPLFPTIGGKAASKNAMVQTFLRAASFLGIASESADGSQHISGHSLRTSGAQGLSRMGMDTWAIQLLGRWGSTTVQRYIRDAASSAEAARARRHALTRSLQNLREDARRDHTAEELRTTAALEVERCFSNFGPRLTAEIREQWRADLQEMLAARPAEKQARSSSSSSSAPADPEAPAEGPPAPQEVASIHSKLKHRVLFGPGDSLDASLWITVCGWRFGRAGGGRQPNEADSGCTKCFPSAAGI